MLLKSLKNNNFGFAVIGIIAIVSAIAILSTASVVIIGKEQEKERDYKRITDTKQIQAAIELYFNDKGSYPTADNPIILGVDKNLILCDGGFVASRSSCPLNKIYMSNIPANPSPNAISYFYTSPSSATDTYSIFFALENETGSLPSGVNVASNSGINNESVAPSFTCGDIIYYLGESYPTVLIGTQCWFAKNLNVGTMITKTATQTSSCASIKKYCYNDTESICATDGGLYQWNQAMCGSTTEGAQGICPSGFHIPKDSEWYTLENYLTTSGACVAGRNICEIPNDNPLGNCCYGAGTAMKTTGSAGFNGIFSGYFNSDRTYYIYRNSIMIFWSSSENYLNAWDRDLSPTKSIVFRASNNKGNSFSIRCLKD